MSINNKLITFAQQELVLARNDAERDRINASLGQLETVLKNKLPGKIKELIRFGSFTRNTILPRKYDPLSDVDLMVVYETGDSPYSPNTYRVELHDVISRAYPNSISTKNFPVVRLELNHIMFDIVPAYSDSGFFGGNTYYYIPDKNNDWQQTIPNDINKPLQEKNQAVKDNIVRNTIRLCKCWNAGAKYPMESYLMEKQIINTFFWAGGDLYNKFVNTLENIAGGRPSVSQAIRYIRQYQGDYFNVPNEEKQLEWLRKLLPGL